MLRLVFVVFKLQLRAMMILPPSGSRPPIDHDRAGALPVRYTPPPPPRPAVARREYTLADFRLPLAPAVALSAEVHTIRFGSEPWLAECAPTVDAWCARHGLQLRVWTEWDPAYPTAKFCEVDMLREFLAGDREWLIYLDADVFVHPLAPVPALEPGFHAFVNPPYKSTLNWPKWIRQTYRARHRNWKYRNMGVWACDRIAAAKILEVAHPPFIAKVQEEYQFNHWLALASAAGMQTAEMDERWNRFAKRAAPAWFHHVTGGKKEDRLRDLRRKRLLPQAPKRGRIRATGDDELAIVYPWRKDAAAWDELRFSLRSIEKHFADKAAPIYLLADEKPDWLAEGGRVRFVHCPRYGDALETGLQLGKRVLWMNDDVYLMRDCSAEDFATAVHHGDLVGKLGWLDDSNTWKAGVARCIVDLHHHGIDRPLNFATHTPYLYEREKAAATLERFGVWHKQPFEILYHNQHGTPAASCGDFRATRLPAGDAAVVLNHSDRTLTAELAAEIEDLFPDPAPWEHRAARVKFRVKGNTDGPIYRGQAQVVPCSTCGKKK